MADLLFELGVEEMPVHCIGETLNRLKTRFRDKLQKNGVTFAHMDAAATNRRFMICLDQVQEPPRESHETIMGPARKVALDADGQPTAALAKFLELNQAAREELHEFETPKGVYFGLLRPLESSPFSEQLALLVREVLEELICPESMIWNDSRRPFLRPIRSLLLLLGTETVDLEFAGVRSANLVRGHMQLSEADFSVDSYLGYIEGLNRNFVILRESERREKIQAEIAEIEEDLELRVPLPAEVLHYHVYATEYPVAFCGIFPEEYLELPPEILTVFLLHDRKLLPTYDKQGRLTNQFVGVANIPDENRRVLRGYEAAVQAAFADAHFFWSVDRRIEFHSLRDTLRALPLEEGGGNWYEKSERLSALTDFLTTESKNMHLREPLQRAAFHCKNDLQTRLVKEFPQMQGLAGGLFLQAAGEPEAVWRSVYEHCRPFERSEEKCQELGSGLLAIADRVDDICAAVYGGNAPGVDGLRRRALAVTRLIVDCRLHFDLNSLIRLAALGFAKKPEELQNLVATVRNLFTGVIESVFKENPDWRYDVVNAVLSCKSDDVYALWLRVQTVVQITASECAPTLVRLHKRLKNMVREYPVLPLSEQSGGPQAVKILFDVFRETKGEITQLLLRRDYLNAAARWLEMAPLIERFIEEAPIAGVPEKVRHNSIALLQRCEELLSGIADFSLLNEKG